MNKLQKQVSKLSEDGLEASEIAEKLGISVTKAQSVLDELAELEEEEEEVEEEDTPTVPTTRTNRQQKYNERKLTRALEGLKDEYDEIATTLKDIDGDTVSREDFEEFLEGVRELEYKFRKTAKKFELPPKSAHGDMLLEIIDELKEKNEDFNEEEDELELDLDEDLLEEANDLRFELLEFSEN